MIEFLTIGLFSKKINKKKNNENKKIQEMFNNNENVTDYITKQTINIDVLNFAMGMVALVISILSAKLAYRCNIKATKVSQFISVTFGFFFPGFYLLYYFIWHSILGNKC